MLSENEVMIKVIRWMISNASNREYIEKLQSIVDGLSNKKHIEQEDSPSYRSILLFGYNIFPLTIGEYRQIIEFIE